MYAIYHAPNQSGHFMLLVGSAVGRSYLDLLGKMLVSSFNQDSCSSGFKGSRFLCDIAVMIPLVSFCIAPNRPASRDVSWETLVTISSICTV